jgi:hypothetical protein
MSVGRVALAGPRVEWGWRLFIARQREGTGAPEALPEGENQKPYERTLQVIENTRRVLWEPRQLIESTVFR